MLDRVYLGSEPNQIQLHSGCAFTVAYFCLFVRVALSSAMCEVYVEKKIGGGFLISTLSIELSVNQ